MIRLGLIGAGKAGELHAQAIARSVRARLAWVADPDRGRADALAARYGARSMADFHEGLGDVDATSVCTPHHLLARTAVEVATAGRHLLLEKPMATSLDDADMVLRAARAAGVCLMVGFVHRYRPDVARAHQLVGDGAIGAPQFVVDRTVSGGLATWPAWVRRPETGGGLVLYSGVHRIDRARWFLGQEIVGVAGSTASLVPGTDVDSSFAAILTGAGDGRAVLSHHSHADEVPFTWETDIHGAGGMLRIRTGHGVDVVTPRGRFSEAAGPDWKFEGEVEAFLDAIEGSPVAIPSGEDGRAVLSIALAVAESSVTGRAVRPDAGAGLRG